MIETVNRQRKVPIRLMRLGDFCAELEKVVIEAGGRSAAVAFVSDRKMRQLNKQFRGVDSTTDVLSFPCKSNAFTRDDCEEITPEGVTLTFLGDIAISVEQAERQAKENELTLETEIKQLMLHGFLHLCGYDHEIDDGEMNARELELRKKLKI